MRPRGSVVFSVLFLAQRSPEPWLQRSQAFYRTSTVAFLQTIAFTSTQRLPEPTPKLQAPHGTSTYYVTAFFLETACRPTYNARKRFIELLLSLLPRLSDFLSQL